MITIVIMIAMILVMIVIIVSKLSFGRIVCNSCKCCFIVISGSELVIATVLKLSI